ncbi:MULTISPECIES: 3-carboxy-cis,cis-muconate cycloisomerase [Mycobacteriaceae]|jgi:3-carboxy-cis,cis-muconate cycloisomerase|uniref:3-carboxy-cis,cis-muconate cycloisomerase n=2 Tax=Mycolicibacterium TaxID=1866885 RepID=G8RNQ0_MYCRN|nr:MULTISPECIES: 3-carboxy-cis,cis-muconate cycloisomerase [Mycobacteriaceae]AEV73751.1 3-carboxy-cis,cis-muconate cycloisomerase [Mycolicibacterium rhodesiae NBB3]MDX1887836.1 3-carboxy-cis,cis-muconate cycloisomerase [Mycolicibacterium sp. 120270]MDZ5089036.1 3-carboxy-cis,cis-muconate cycloisomerase [Mycolicibacterium parafortuitum]BBA72668.1 fumarate lyase [Mycobacterium sp. PO1]BBA72694.1 fumarate lyase [Mycobacterium sp. PO2]
MTDLFWPGDHRADDLMSDRAFLAAMVAVEQAWLAALVGAGIAPEEALADLAGYLADGDLEAIARGADADGNPVSGLVALLRIRTAQPTAQWLHRGLTSQDVVDTALMVCVRDAVDRLRKELAHQVRALSRLAETHSGTPMLARTLTQAALPSTVGVKVTRWLSAVLDAAEPLTELRVPVQAGGAAGTLAAAVELSGSVEGAISLSDSLAVALGLAPAPPWHTTRSAITRIGDALVSCCDAWGYIAADVATGSRPEIGEFAEAGGGSSSTMPHKSNPVRSVLLRRTAITAAPLAATLHTASAMSVDERSDGAWHAEWATLRTLARHTVVAAAHATELLAGLQIDVERARANLGAADRVLSEQKTMTDLTGHAASAEYLGAVEQLVDAALHRAGHYLKDAP